MPSAHVRRGSDFMRQMYENSLRNGLVELSNMFQSVVQRRKEVQLFLLQNRALSQMPNNMHGMRTGCLQASFVDMRAVQSNTMPERRHLLPYLFEFHLQVGSNSLCGM
jgi:hypothetical protein